MRLRHFLKSCDGVSAVEFALAAPVLALILMGIASGWTSAVDVSDMKDSVRSAAAYVLKGGLDPDAAKSVAKPSAKPVAKAKPAPKRKARAAKRPVRSTPAVAEAAAPTVAAEVATPVTEETTPA